MNSKICLLIFLIPFFVFSQNKSNTNGEIVYQYNKNLGILVSEEWTLTFDSGISLFLQTGSPKRVNKNASEIVKESSFKNNHFSSIVYTNSEQNKYPENAIVRYIKIEGIPHYITDLAKDSIYSQRHIVETPYYVSEKNVRTEWVLFDETKQIGEFVCQKATTSFRGRNYTAWFTSQIPVNLGPWKLNGLPGLILEVYDDSKQVQFVAEKILVNSDIDVDLKLKTIEKFGKRISLMEFVPLLDNQGRELVKQINTKTPRGVSTSFTSAGRNDIEMAYEWEN